MIYTKRSYQDVENTFEYSVESPFLALFGLIPIIHKISMGVNSKGIWLYHVDAVHEIGNAKYRYGFFEWNWIKEIHVSESDERAYFIFHDIDGVLENVIIDKAMGLFNKFFVVSHEGERAIAFKMFRKEHFKALKYVSEHQYAKVIAIR